MTEVFVGQPLASPRSDKKNLDLDIVLEMWGRREGTADEMGQQAEG